MLPMPPARTFLYSLILAVAAAWVAFTNLGGNRIEGDEALYAICTDQIRATGEWLTLRPRPPTPYFGKPPLYMWLSASTYNLVPGLEVKYRAWSAFFGVLAVVGTAWLGARLISPETGAMAGAFLLTNRAFLEDHGVRYGGMDAGLACLMAFCLLLYWRSLDRPTRWGGWIAIGLLAGLAWLLKPLFGLPILAVILVHAMLFGRGRRGSLLLGLLIAALVMLAVGMPWYLLQWARFGSDYTHALLHRQVLERTTTAFHSGEERGGGFYLVHLTRSSVPFFLTIPALLAALVGSIRDNPRRAAFGLIALAGIGWLIACSLIKTRFIHYLFPVFPLIGIGIAVLLEQVGIWIARQIALRRMNPPAARRFLCVAFVAIALLLVFRICALAMLLQPRDHKNYATRDIHDVFRPAIARGDARLIMAGLPVRAEQWDLGLTVPPGDRFYLSHLTGVTAATPAELEQLLQEHKPTLLLTSRLSPLQPVLDRAGVAARADPRFAFEHRTYSTIAIDTASLLDPVLAQNQPTPWIQLAGHPDSKLPAPFEGKIRLRIRPPLPQQTWVSVLIHPESPAAPHALRYSVTGADHAPSGKLSIPTARSIRLWAEVSRENLQAAEREVTFHLFSAAPDGLPVRGAIEEVRLRVSPAIPSDDSID